MRWVCTFFVTHNNVTLLILYCIPPEKVKTRIKKYHYKVPIDSNILLNNVMQKYRK